MDEIPVTVLKIKGSSGILGGTNTSNCMEMRKALVRWNAGLALL